jgi:hypothetical protein
MSAKSLLTALALLVIGAMTLGAGNDPAKWKLPELDQALREAIVSDANQAINKHVRVERKAPAPDDIDPAFWGTAISKLKPIRVRNDRVNVAIVLAEKDGVEEGLYVSIPISSYAARIGDRFTLLKKLTTEQDKSFGTLYHYRLLPKAK